MDTLPIKRGIKEKVNKYNEKKKKTPPKSETRGQTLRHHTSTE